MSHVFGAIRCEQVWVNLCKSTENAIHLFMLYLYSLCLWLCSAMRVFQVHFYFIFYTTESNQLIYVRLLKLSFGVFFIIFYYFYRIHCLFVYYVLFLDLIHFIILSNLCNSALDLFVVSVVSFCNFFLFLSLFTLVRNLAIWVKNNSMVCKNVFFIEETESLTNSQENFKNIWVSQIQISVQILGSYILLWFKKNRLEATILRKPVDFLSNCFVLYLQCGKICTKKRRRN